ncbi:ALP1-like protein isoform X1 [Tanacetum coccineum]
MMSDSDGGDLSDVDDFDDLDMIMRQVQSEQQQEEEAERVRHRNYIYRERLDAEARLMADYFGPHPKYPENHFRKLYRMSRTLFFKNSLSIDCMHWEWKNYPKEWDGQFARGDKKYPTIMLEVVASYDLWVWHAFFGVAGANNNLTVLNYSPLFDDLLDDIAPVAPFECNGVTFEKGYYLADGIYPQWSSFVKSFTVANSEKNVLFKQKQKSARKDVERAFGVLHGRWHIICQPARAWTVNKLRRIMYTCIILHNMILKDQKFALSEFDQQNYICPQANILRTWVERCELQRRKSKELRDKQTHAKLQRNVIEHIWQQHLQHQHED